MNGIANKTVVSRGLVGPVSYQILPANGDRDLLIVQNEGTTPLYIKFGAEASLTDYSVKLPRGGVMEYSIWIGPLAAVRAAGYEWATATEII